MELKYVREGSGEPLLLIHGTGGSHRAWKPVMPALAAERDVVAVSLPGHGESPLPPPGVEPTPVGYAPILVDLLERLDMAPAHVAGYSVGGWTALEIAKLGGARSVVALCPAGLWGDEDPRRALLKLAVSYRMGQHGRSLARRLVKSAKGRKLLLGGEAAHPENIPPDDAFDLIQTFSSTRGFEEHLAAVRRTWFAGGQGIDVPVTIAWGDDDKLLTERKARKRDQLPASARWIELEGCGHVPMYDDPDLIVRTILEGSRLAPEPAQPQAT